MAMQGSLQDMAIADLIQHNCHDHKTAELIVSHNGQKASLYFNEGNVQHATLEDDQGEEVVYELLTWQDGDFTLNIDVKPPVVTIKRSWSGLLLEGARRLDEALTESNSLSTDKRMNKMASKKSANLDAMFDEIMAIDGAMAAALVDWQSGMTLGTVGNGINIDVAAAGNANVVKSKFAVMKDLGLGDILEDILITLEDQYHLIRPLQSNSNLFLYLALNKAQSNLGMARFRLAEAESDLNM